MVLQTWATSPTQHTVLHARFSSCTKYLNLQSWSSSHTPNRVLHYGPPSSLHVLSSYHSTRAHSTHGTLTTLLLLATHKELHPWSTSPTPQTHSSHCHSAPLYTVFQSRSSTPCYTLSSNHGPECSSQSPPNPFYTQSSFHLKPATLYTWPSTIFLSAHSKNVLPPWSSSPIPHIFPHP